MKLPSVITLVAALHAVVLAGLFVLPGCQTVTAPADPESAPASASTDSAPVEEPTPHIAHPEPEGPDEQPRLLPPTRPQWNLSDMEEPVPLPGYDSEPETGLNAPEIEAVAMTSPPSQQPELEPLPSPTRPSPTRPAPVVDASASGVQATYQVQGGDNLTRIARRFGVTVTALREANGLSSDTIYVGQELKIPEVTEPSAAPTPGPEAAATAQGETYTVVSGDSLIAIARRFGVTVAALREANGLKSDVIYVGQELVVPEGTAPPAPPASAPAPGGTSTGTYQVKPGETLGAISRRFGIPLADLMRANNITDPRRLRAGQVLTLPDESVPLPSQPQPSAPAPRAPQPSAPASPAPQPTAFPSEVEPADTLVDVDELDPEDAMLLDLDNAPQVEVIEE